MLFHRLVWCALGVAVVLGTAQSAIQQFQTVPLILAAEVFEQARAEPVTPTEQSLVPAHVHAEAHAHAQAAPHEHHDAQASSPAEGTERNAWTWVANVLHAMSMALLMFAVMGLWVYRKGAGVGSVHLALAVASAGWLSLHFWPSLGLAAELPGMQAAALGARQGWWLLAVVSAALACAALTFNTWRWRVAAALLLALPFVIGAPMHSVDALAGFSGAAQLQMEQLGHQFFWATTWVSLSFWSMLGLLSAAVFKRWLVPVLSRRGPTPTQALPVASLLHD